MKRLMLLALILSGTAFGLGGPYFEEGRKYEATKMYGNFPPLSSFELIQQVDTFDVFSGNGVAVLVSRKHGYPVLHRGDTPEVYDENATETWTFEYRYLGETTYNDRDGFKVRAFLFEPVKVKIPEPEQ